MLGIEIALYAFSPWILKSRWLSWAAGTVCFGIFAATAVGGLPANIYTYYTSPGPMIFYLLGSFLYRKDWTSLGVFTAALVGILCYELPQRFNAEFLLGVVVGLPIMILLSRFPMNKIDAALGDASYGCFLGHVIVIWTMTHYLGVTEFTPTFRFAIVLLSCLAGYVAFYLVERPTVPFRRRLKGGFKPT